MNVGLEGKKVALVQAEGVPEAVTSAWRHALEESGAVVEAVGAEDGAASASMDYEALVAIGGAGERTADRAAATPRFPKAVVQLARELAAVEKPVVAVGTAVALLVEADVVRGRKVAAPEALRETLEQAGAHWSGAAQECDERMLTVRDASATDARALRGMVGSLAGASEQLAVDRMSEQSFPASDPPPPPTTI